MKYGVTAFINDKSLGIIEFATTAERLGFESIWLGEHDHLPVATVHPWVEGGTPPDIYKRFPDPFTLFAAAAAVTEKLRFGTSVSLIGEHNPIYFAKQVATLDFVSGGRVELGVGYGWNKLEMANNGIDSARPRTVFREKLRALKALWTEEEASFSGEFVSFTPSWSYPKPVQKPYPPIILGSALTPGATKDMVESMDGWMPIRTTMTFDELAEAIGTLRARATEAGRDPRSISISLLDPDGSMGGKKSLEAFERRLPSVELLERYESELAIDRCIFAVPGHDPELFHATMGALAARAGLGKKAETPA